VSQLPTRVDEAFANHESFVAPDDAGADTSTGTDTGDGESDDDGASRVRRYRDVSSPFDATVTVDTATGDDQMADRQPVRYRIVVSVPTLAAVASDEVAPVVDDGWYDTFERRVVDVGGITRGDHDLSPSVSRDGDTVRVDVELTDTNPRRGAADAAAFVDFVEGTYLQGVVPGYEYDDPVASMLHDARERGSATDAASGASTTDSDRSDSSLRGGGSLRGGRRPDTDN
jgi:hypothetical protein